MQTLLCVSVRDVIEDERVAAADDPTLLAAAELFKTLSTPLRLGIVAQLSKGEHRVQELVEELGASQPLISQHLRLMRSAHLVRGTRQGREVVYTLADNHIAHIVLDALQHVAEEPPAADAADAV